MVAVVGVVAVAVLLIKRRQGSARSHVGCLLAAPAIAIAIPFVLFARGKPPEYGRFPIVLDVALLVATCSLVARVKNAKAQAGAALLLLITVIAAGFPYLRGFVLDSRPLTSRLLVAKEVRALPGDVILQAEPAPYDCPPIDLFSRRLILAPTKWQPINGTRLQVDPARPNAISWANVHFDVSWVSYSR